MQSYNIATAFVDMARLQPDATAIAIPRGSSMSQNRTLKYREVSFSALVSEVQTVARGLLEAGFQKGERVIMMVPPGLDFFVVSFALLQTGMIPVFIDPGMGPGNMKKCIAEAAPAGFIGISKAHVARILLGWGRKTIRKCVTLGPRLFWGGTGMHGILRRGSHAHADHFFDPMPDDMAAIIFTSGSTGLPKGVVYTHGNFHAQLQMIRDAFGHAPGDIDLPTFPPYALFNAALGVTSILPFTKPTRPAAVNPLRIIGPIQQFGVNSMFASPAILDKVARYAELNGVRLPSLKRVISSGAPVPTRTLARFSALLDRGATILTPYGSTEAMPVSSVNSHQLLTDTYKKTDNGGGICVGKPLNGSEVVIIKITDDIIPRWTEDLRVPPGTIGEIVVKGKQVTRSYFARQHATQLAKIQDGEDVRHRMGDVGYFDAEGLLWYCGRKADRIKQGTRELFSIPCEYIFNKHPDVFRTALVEFDGKAVLCVEVDKNRGAVNTGQLHQELLDMAAQYPMTREISTILFHTGFPVDIRHNAKIIREQLAAWVKKKSG